MGKQTGFIFYVPARNTSKIDFATGFTNFLYPKYENEKQAKDFIGRFKNICFNPVKDYFEFTASYNSFVKDEKAKLGEDKIWTICTYGKERYHYRPTDKTNLCVDATERMKRLFDEYKISYSDGGNLIPAIISVGGATCLNDLMFYLRLILLMRYTDGKELDYILSPVEPFFDSRNAKNNEPADADANGAYHIAMKGLLMLNKIREGEKDLRIEQKQWINFIQGRQKVKAVKI